MAKNIKWLNVSKEFLGPIVVIILMIMWSLSFIVEKNNQNKLQETLIQISQNAVVRKNISPDNDAVKELKKQFKSQNSLILSKYEEERKKTKEMMTQIGKIKAELDRSRKLYVSSDKIYKKESQDPKHWYFFKKITRKSSDGEVPIAWVMFYPYQSPDKQWKYGTYEMTIDVSAIQSENRDGTFNQYAEIDLFGKDNKEIPVKNINVEWQKIQIKDKNFDIWNPRLALGTNFTDNFDAGINLSLMSYGRTKVDMDWRFLTFGTGIDNDKWYLTFEPLSFNIGKKLPLIENIFIGPIIKYKIDGLNDDFEYGGQVSVPF